MVVVEEISGPWQHAPRRFRKILLYENAHTMKSCARRSIYIVYWN
jgi:hypothetical protein